MVKLPVIWDSMTFLCRHCSSKNILTFIELSACNVFYFQYWLDHEKMVLKQLPLNDLNFKFLIKFYTPDPGLLEEEYTRSVQGQIGKWNWKNYESESRDTAVDLNS